MDVAESDFGRAVIARLDELRLLATENRIDADLRTGVTATLVAELRVWWWVSRCASRWPPG